MEEKNRKATERRLKREKELAYETQFKQDFSRDGLGGAALRPSLWEKVKMNKNNPYVLTCPDRFGKGDEVSDFLWNSQLHEFGAFNADYPMAQLNLTVKARVDLNQLPGGNAARFDLQRVQRGGVLTLAQRKALQERAEHNRRLDLADLDPEVADELLVRLSF